MAIAVNQGPVLGNTIIPPPSSIEDLEVPGWVKSSAKMLNGGLEGQDWLALAKKLGTACCLWLWASSLKTVQYVMYFRFRE